MPDILRRDALDVGARVVRPVVRALSLAALFVVALPALGAEAAAFKVDRPENGLAYEQSPWAGLAAALQATLNNHPAVKGKQAEVNASQGLTQSAKAARYPSLSGQAQTLESGDNTGTLRLRQPLWAFGRIDAGIEQAEAQGQAEKALLLQVQRELIEQTAVAYTHVQSLTERLAIAEANVAEHQQLLERIETRYRGQVASLADVRLATARLVRARGDYQRLQGEREAAITELQRLTQVPVAVEPRLPSVPFRLPGRPEIHRLAQTQHADVRVKQAQAEVAKLKIRSTQLADTPTVFLQVDQDILDTPEGVDRTRVGVVIEARTEGFGFALRGRIESARQSYEAALFDLDSTRNEVRQRLETLLVNRALLEQLRAYQQDAVAAVEDTLASYIRQYDSGRKSWIEVLNMQREVTDVRQQLAQINYDWQTTTLRIAALIGALDDLAGLSFE